MKQLRHATENDILELKRRLREHKERLLLDRDAQEAFDMVRRHRMIKEGNKNEK